MRFERITVDPEQMGGVPCARGLRIPVATVVGLVAQGMTEAWIMAEYPDLELEVERRVPLERLVREPRLAHVGEAPQTRFVAPVGPRHEERTVSVEQAAGLYTLAASPSRRLGEISELDHAKRRDRFAEKGNQTGVEARPRTRAHRQTLGVHER